MTTLSDDKVLSVANMEMVQNPLIEVHLLWVCDRLICLKRWNYKNLIIPHHSPSNILFGQIQDAAGCKLQLLPRAIYTTSYPHSACMMYTL